MVHSVPIFVSFQAFVYQTFVTFCDQTFVIKRLWQSPTGQSKFHYWSLSQTKPGSRACIYVNYCGIESVCFSEQDEVPDKEFSTKPVSVFTLVSRKDAVEHGDGCPVGRTVKSRA